jgi:hypothetical protein
MRHPCLPARAVANPPEPRTEEGIVPMNFKHSPKYVLAYEGGWVDHPKDPFGAIMKGVTLATLGRGRAR